MQAARKLNSCKGGKINGGWKETNLEEKIEASPAKDRRAQNDLSVSFWEDIRKYTIPHCKTVELELWRSSAQFFWCNSVLG